MTGERIRLVVADDHPVYRDGLARLLAELDGIDVVGVAADGLEAVEQCEQLDPDVALIDVRMPRLDGIVATERIAATRPDVGVVVLTMVDDDEVLLAAVCAGARAVLLKDADVFEIAGTLHGVAGGRAAFGRRPAGRVLEHLRALAGRLGATGEHPFPQLTAREREVLELIAGGHSNTQIARRLFLSERTVRNYVSMIFAKLGTGDRARTIAVARDAGIGGR